MKNYPYEVHYRMHSSAEARWLWSAAYPTREIAELNVAFASKLYFHERTRFAIVENHTEKVAIVIDPGVAAIDLPE